MDRKRSSNKDGEDEKNQSKDDSVELTSLVLTQTDYSYEESNTTRTMVDHAESSSLLPQRRNQHAGAVTSTSLPESSQQRQPSRRRIQVSAALFTFAVLTMGIVIGFVVSQNTASKNQHETAEDATTKEQQQQQQPEIVLSVPSEGGKKHKENKNAQVSDEKTLLSYCQDGKYSKRTLKLAYELPFASLFQDPKGQKKFEASSVIVANDTAYAVCDSSWSISKFGAQLQPFHPDNVQVGDPNREPDEDSGYEALLLVDKNMNNDNNDETSLYVVRESILHNEEEEYHAVMEKLVLTTTDDNNNNDNDDYKVVEACSTEFTFEGDSKGFEGAIAIRDLNNELVILGLCEGNYCSEAHKDDVGNGKLVAMRRRQQQATDNSSGDCQWSTIRMIDIPSSAAFRDYSAITLRKDKVAISSQEESQLWVGRLGGRRESDGLWDIDAIEFQKKGKVYDFPKNDNCQTIYCNIEGVHWLNAHTLMAVSDKMKGKGKQDFRCFDKDQSVHVFVLP